MGIWWTRPPFEDNVKRLMDWKAQAFCITGRGPLHKAGPCAGGQFFVLSISSVGSALEPRILLSTLCQEMQPPQTTLADKGGRGPVQRMPSSCTYHRKGAQLNSTKAGWPVEQPEGARKGQTVRGEERKQNCAHDIRNRHVAENILRVSRSKISESIK